jgi:hypothetical protein
MSNLFQSLLDDALTQLKKPEVKTMMEVHIVKPVILTVMNILYPYLLGVMLLWIIMFICVALILLILIRGSLPLAVLRE